VLGLGKVEDSCRFCGASLNPEEVHRLPVPLFDRTYDVCVACRDAWRNGGRELVPFEPGFRADRGYRWIGPIAEDAFTLLRKIAAEAGDAALVAPVLEGDARKALPRLVETMRESELALAGALAAAIVVGDEVGPLEEISRLVDKVARTEATPLLFGVYAHARAGPPPVGAKLPKKPESAARRAHLEAARGAYLLHLPFALRDELDARIASLHVLASLELGNADDAEAKLRQYRRNADAKPSARDPRLPLLHAFLQLATGNLAAVDEALKTGLAWAQASPEPSRWAEVEAVLWFDTYVRAVDSGRWEPARDAMKRYSRLRPSDRRALYDLAHTFMKTSLDPVAREVLASYHAFDPRDEDGLLLYATCLSRLGETHAAWVLLRDDLDTERDEEKLGGERRHLAALSAHAEGDDDRAIELLAEAHALSPDDRTRENLVFLIQEELAQRVERLTTETWNEEIVAFLRRHGDVLKKEIGQAGLAFMQGFVAREVRDGFKAAHSFGPDLFEKLRFSDAEMTTLQAYGLLAQRKLGDAVRKDREAQGSGGRPIPFALLLAFLDKIRSWPESDREMFKAG
jgi:tetratricopeptide (TPR) repeat protein